MAKRLRFNAFQMNAASHQSPGLWTHPRDHSHRHTDPDHWVERARLLERGRFDGVFLADVLDVYDVYGGAVDAALRGGVQVPLGRPAGVGADHGAGDRAPRLRRHLRPHLRAPLPVRPPPVDARPSDPLPGRLEHRHRRPRQRRTQPRPHATAQPRRPLRSRGVPELQRRGRYALEYLPGTLRHKLFGRGARLPDNHHARQLRLDNPSGAPVARAD